jgi:hypothetical protein
MKEKITNKNPIKNTIKRRTLLKGGASALLMPWHSIYGWADDFEPIKKANGRIPIVFHEPAEVLICGSTLFACQLAIRSAKAGRRTVLVFDRVNPYFEGITCLHSWFEPDKIPELLNKVAGDSKTSEIVNGRHYFNSSKACIDIENQLIDSGVHFLYNATVAGALGNEEKITGVVFGGKTGLFAIEAGIVVDATVEATVARAAGAQTYIQKGPRQYHYIVDLATPVAPRKLIYKSTNGAQVEVNIHHYYASFDIKIDSQTNGPFAPANDFAQIYAATLECPWESHEKRFRGADGYMCSGIDRMEAIKPGTVKGAKNLLVFGPQGMPKNTKGSLVLRKTNVLEQAFPDALEEILTNNTQITRPRPIYTFWNYGVSSDSSPKPELIHNFIDHGFSEPGSENCEIIFNPPVVTLKSDVMVTGGGTSGNAASYAAAGLGLNTICIEKGLELGGTNTLGGVTNLWFGNKTKAFEEYYQAMGAVDDGLNAPAFFKGLNREGCRVLLGTVVTGVATEGRFIRRIYVLTPMGMTALEAPHIIDATGDGSIAAWAGCGYSFGGEHDEMTLWASFAAFRPGRQEAARPFRAPCDERSAIDTTRFILAMRRNGRVDLNQKHVPHPFYLAPRETRHIRGGKTLTFLDTIAERRFHDGVFRVESNPDIKGLATSDAAKAGFIPINWLKLFQVTVPYSAMIPTGADNVIIAGKAYSVSHDALSLARMQRDMCVMGMVVAEAVHLASVNMVLLREIPIKDLQSILMAKGMLKSSDVSDDDYGFGRKPEEMVENVVKSEDFDACLSDSARLCLLPREKTLSLLLPYAAMKNPYLHRILCFLGNDDGIKYYASQIEEELDQPKLNKELFGKKGTKHLMPDQGYAPDIALMLGSLTYVHAQQAVMLLIKLSNKLQKETIVATEEDLRFAWGYFYSIACGFERMACKEGKLPLKQLLSLPLFKDRLVTRNCDLRKTSDTISERLAYLRMALARALTRCGDTTGAIDLCSFLDESRVCLARAARAELIEATGKDLGFNAKAWRKLLYNHGEKLNPNPLKKKFA